MTKSYFQKDLSYATVVVLHVPVHYKNKLASNELARLLKIPVNI